MHLTNPIAGLALGLVFFLFVGLATLAALLRRMRTTADHTANAQHGGPEEHFRSAASYATSGAG